MFKIYYIYIMVKWKNLYQNKDFKNIKLIAKQNLNMNIGQRICSGISIIGMNKI